MPTNSIGQHVQSESGVADDEVIRTFARELATTHKAVTTPARYSRLPFDLAASGKILRQARTSLTDTLESDATRAYVAEWLLDNFHIVQEVLREIPHDMPPGFYRKLPVLTGDAAENCPRVYAVARCLVEQNDGRITAELLEEFVADYQQVTVLSTGELWALPTMLRACLIHQLSETVASLLGSATTADRSDDAPTPDALVSNCVQSLRRLQIQDWEALFENLSLVEGRLRRDPANVYRRMDFETRDTYRGVIEKLAEATHLDELEVAELAIRLAEESLDREPDVSRASHVGYYLIDAGRADLEERAGYRPTLAERARRYPIRHPAPFFFGSIAAVVFLGESAALGYASVAEATYAQYAIVGLLTLIPALTVAVSLVNFLVTSTLPPRRLPKLDFREGLDEETRTLLVVPALLSKESDVDGLLHNIELHYLRNPLPNLWFALLTDFTDACTRARETDGPLLERAETGILALNERYSSKPFLLLHRERLWNPSEGVWMGWERKRGKLEELNRLILGKGNTSFTTLAGNIEILPDIRYVITLDADTVLPQGAADRLVGSLAHPLNQAVFDPVTNGVTHGYTVLQPRPEIGTANANVSLFTRIFSSDAGLDLYTHAVSDVYQDLFGEGIYVGKGIYDVAAFHRSVEGRVPENTLLSHDLFEGIAGRAGLVSDIVVFEDYPVNYLVYVNRLQRWIRGDWQLLPWLLPGMPAGHPKRSSLHLTLLDRWKIVDNLRRSLLEPALVGFLIAAWFFLPGNPLTWTLSVIFIPIIPLLAGAVSAIARRGVVRFSPEIHVLGADALRWAALIVFLLHEAVIKFHTIGVTLIRLYFTRRHMLQWTTAESAKQRLGEGENGWQEWRRMSIAPLVSLGLFASVYLVRPSVLPFALPFLFAWFLSPQVARWISRPLSRPVRRLKADDEVRLRSVARRTWFFFERFVGPEDHWLPPDHFQESPRGLVAHRTSPTNIGLYMLSALSAYDMGYTDILAFTARMKSTLASMERLEKYQGHLLNWYDTHSLLPLPPRYVSSVDSGNLAGCLIALRQGCLEIVNNPIPRWQRFEGLADTLAVAEEYAEGLVAEGSGAAAEFRDDLRRIQRLILDAKDRPDTWIDLLFELRLNQEPKLDQDLISFLRDHATSLNVKILHSLNTWTKRVHVHVSNMHRELLMLVPWTLMLRDAPKLLAEAESGSPLDQAWQNLKQALPSSVTLKKFDYIADRAEARLSELMERLRCEAHDLDDYSSAQRWCEDLEKRIDHAATSAQDTLKECNAIVRSVGKSLERMDFRFLLEERRKVFRIGYNVDSETPDANCYDLLASEARVTSLIAIAKGDAPIEHWLRLGRPVTRAGGKRTLISWNGTMFEYLMPALLTRSYGHTLLDESMRTAVQAHIDYGRKQSVPWGISESGYFHFDGSMNYQYRGFGVPGLGYRRGLSEDLVVTPYASLLALAVCPHEVGENLDRLVALKMLGDYGFYEAIDFTPARLSLGSKHARVESFMAHHQGMILVAVMNHLHGDLMRDRFHADPLIQSAEMLLQERLPRHIPTAQVSTESQSLPSVTGLSTAVMPWNTPTRTPIPLVHYLSNGRLGTMISNAGSGYTVWKDNDVTRWRSDSTLEPFGTWIYLQDCESGKLWSVAEQPVPDTTLHREVMFSPHAAAFQCTTNQISSRMEIVIAPDDDVEIRRIRVTNDGDSPRTIRIASYCEMVLGPRVDDRRHQAFAKLFVESVFDGVSKLLIFSRRPRAPEESPMHAACTLVSEEDQNPSFQFETDRILFLGRMRNLSEPAVFKDSEMRTSCTAGAARDTIAALVKSFSLEPHETIQMAIVTSVADSRSQAAAAAKRYKNWSHITHTFELARVQAELEMRKFEASTTELIRFQRLLSALIYPCKTSRADPATISANTKGQNGLWGYDLSGDYPIVLVKICGDEHAHLVIEVLRAHRYWRNRHIMVDVVILNERESSYAQEDHGRLHRLISRMHSDAWLNRRGGIFLLRTDTMPNEDIILFETVARVILSGEQGELDSQLQRMLVQDVRLPLLEPAINRPKALAEAPIVERPDDLLFDNGIGGFTPDGREYVMFLEKDNPTPAPWVNVIANSDFGCLVSEAGTGYTWSLNSGENRLTPWMNDPVQDPPGEALYLRDEETGVVWSPTLSPAGDDAPYLARHGLGYSEFEHGSQGLLQQTEVFVVADAPVKVIRLRLENVWPNMRRVTATYYAEWVLGVDREDTQSFIVPKYNHESQALLARNTYSEEFSGRVAFLAASEALHGLTTDRLEFLGRLGDRKLPAALRRVGLSGRVEPGSDPCAVIQVHLDIPPGGVKEIHFLLGQEEDESAALLRIKDLKQVANIDRVRAETRQTWNTFLKPIQVTTPDAAMNIMLNSWLLYQTVSCRIWARSALYQSSGAYGFRDQLQDVMAILIHDPRLARSHILRAAGHQFEEGDVLHWWHPLSLRGVRTRISDDLLWLPFVTAHYVESTGDRSILHEQVPFLVGETLKPDETERYAVYKESEKACSLYDHCLRAIERGATEGAHGLPLMAGGDWNDGMNRVGSEGKGESVWLGWFVYSVLAKFAPLCEEMQDRETSKEMQNRAARLQEAIETHGWDGHWYRRAFYDDGRPLGSHENHECRFDSIAQSWAVLSGAADRERAKQAMDEMYKELARSDPNLILLFNPPFSATREDPGYIKGYPPGIRENGGQYTHAAAWAGCAAARLGDGDRAAKIFDTINPISHGDSPAKVEMYRVEPYVAAGDIYSVDPYSGRGGWTWYTGASGWMYRLGVEEILGIKKHGEELRIDPCIPRAWPEYSVVFRYQDTVWHIQVKNDHHVSRGVDSVTIDGERTVKPSIPLVNDGMQHIVVVFLGVPSTVPPENSY